MAEQLIPDIARIDGQIEECQIILEAFENKQSPNRQIITQPMTYFKNRIATLEAKKKELEDEVQSS